jgi:VWFA-related protein
MAVRRRFLWLFLSLAFLIFHPLAIWAQHTGGGSHTGAPSSTTNASANARNAAVLGTGSSSNASVHLTSASDEPRVEFRTQTVLIQVPVVVLDKAGNHLHGLTQDGFHIFENGKEQKISTFEEQVATNGPLMVQSAPAGSFRNFALDGKDPRNVVVVALDTVNTPYLDQTTGRRELVKYLAQTIDSGQVLALFLITSHGLRVVQGLTGDPTQLIAALKKASGELPGMQGIGTDAQADAVTGDMSSTISSPGGDPLQALDAFVEHGEAVEAQFLQQNAIQTTMNAFLGIASSLSGVPGRKSLLWATGGFPFAMNSPENVPGGNLSLLYERAMLALNNAQISVYPVDIRGLANTSPFADASRSHSVTGLNASRLATNRAWLQQSSLDTLNDFANMTGGKAFYNTNDLAGSFKRAADDASSYYLVGYYLDTHNDTPGWRKLHVKVDRKDTEIRARAGFFVTNATMNPLVSRNVDIANALSSPIDGTGIPVTVRWLGMANDGDKRKVVFLAQMAPDALGFDSGGRNRLNFDFAAVAFGEKDGKEVTRMQQNFANSVPDAQLDSVHKTGVGYRNTLDLVPGKYMVRFVVRDNVTGKVGSVMAPLTVN